MADYFTSETDDYIRRFQEADDDESKHRLFDEGIRGAFEKLIDGLICSYKFYSVGNIETLRRDCLSTLYETIPKFDTTKGKKGFSYFNVVAKHWFIQKTREHSKRSRLEKEIVDIDSKTIRNNPKLVDNHCEDDVIEREFWVSLHSELDSWRSLVTNVNDAKVLEAVIHLFANPSKYEIATKKAFYLYIREMTGLNEKQLAVSLKRLREMYKSWKNRYDEGDV